MSINLQVTQNLYNKWKNELRKIDDELKRLNNEREKLIGLLHAADYLHAQLAPAKEGKEAEPEPQKLWGSVEASSFANLSAVEAIRNILRASQTPLRKVELKRRLKEAGFPMERFGAQGGYYYTALMRMKHRGIITMDGDSVALK